MRLEHVLGNPRAARRLSSGQARTKRTPHGLAVQSFHDLLLELATIVKNRIRSALKSLASFQHPEGYFEQIWKKYPYFHMLNGIPMFWFAAITIVLGALALRTSGGLTAVAYSTALIATATLVSLATCATSFAGARFFLPAYSLLQISSMVVALVQLGSSHRP